MGIRFRCHHCEFELHVKDFQAGKRGRCPECKGKFRIPMTDAEHSLEAEAELPDAALQLDVEALRENAAIDSGPAPASDAVKAGQQLEEPSQSDAASPPQIAAGPQQPQILIEYPEARWLVRPSSGGEYGPAPSSAMWQWLNEHRIGRDSLIWCEGWPEWRIAADLFSDFFVAVDAQNEKVPPVSMHASEATNATVTQSKRELNPVDSVRARRNRNRRRNYAILITVLSLLMIGLVVALVVVLQSQ